MGDIMLISGTIIYNEKNRFLKQWLEEVPQYFDKMIILDDASDDGTFEYIKNSKPYKEGKIILERNEKNMFKINECILRKTLWDLIRKNSKDNDFCIILDSDEIPCPELKDKLQEIIKNNIGLFSFKKIEMWDDKNYRIDGLWSNYFSRGFPIYINEEYGFEQSGFHFPPTPRYTLSLRTINSDIRIKHLAYKSEELRKAKYDFMMNNSQQTKDITYYHLQTINEKAKCKEYKIVQDKPKILLAFICVNLYELPETTKQTLLSSTYPKENIDIVFLASGTSGKIINQIEELEAICEKNEFFLINYQEEEYNRQVQDRKATLKREFFDKYSEKYKKYEHIFIIDGEYPFREDVIYHHLLTDKDTIINRVDTKVISLSKEIFKMLIEKRHYLFIKGPMENIKLGDIISNMDVYVWSAMYGPPFPLNVNKILIKKELEK